MCPSSAHELRTCLPPFSASHPAPPPRGSQFCGFRFSRQCGIDVASALCYRFLMHKSSFRLLQRASSRISGGLDSCGASRLCAVFLSPVRFAAAVITPVFVAASVSVLIFTAAAVFAFAPPAHASEYPRRIAVAPFASFAKEDIGTTVAVLPRLVSSRLMALAGADVLLLKAGGKSATDAAREARYPLLLEGTISKLGKGYSIDVTVTDLADGKSAGAFFTAAATEDDIIAQLGVLSGDIAEKVFGVQGAARAVAPPVVAAPVIAGPSVVADTAAAAPGATTAQQPQQPQAPASAQGFLTTGAPLSDGWIPSSIKKISQSDKITDELNGIVTVRVDDERNALVAAYGQSVIYLFRIKEDEILRYTAVRRPIGQHILSVDVFDIDGDGENEILVTNLVEESIRSFILKKNGDIYEEIAENIRYYLMVLPDWKGKRTLVGQYHGLDTPFKGKIVALTWDGKKLVPGEALPHLTTISPLSSGAPGISSGRFDDEWRLIYVDNDSFLRVLDAEGKSTYKSRDRHGARLDFFEWGPYIVADGRRKWYPLRNPARLAPGSGNTPVVMTTEMTKGLLDLVGGLYDSTRIVLLRWEVGEFLMQAGTQSSSQFFSGADFLSRSDFSKGDRVIVSVIEQQGVLLKDQISRVLLYQVE